MDTPRSRLLDGTWEATASSDTLRRDLDDTGDETWVPVTVPGHWQATPELADHAGALLYRRRFDAHPIDADERCWLELDGIFSQGDVWLDGEYVGDTEGYFFPHRFDVTELVAGADSHQLDIEVVSNPIGDPDRKQVLTGSFQQGDFLAPSVNPGGIWRPTRLRTTGPVSILHSRIRCAEAGPDTARVECRLVLDARRAETVTITTRIGDESHERTQALAAGENRLDWSITHPEPQLWWPRRMGEQHLYDITVSVDLESGDTSDLLRTRTGMRSVRTEDGNLVVNGERLYLKGACVGPATPLLGTATTEELRCDIDLAIEAGLDMIALHAHIARPETYDHADRTGMLIWQDLPLAGSYARAVKPQALRQAREAVDLLAHHPSVAIWCPRSNPDGASRSTERRLAGAGLDRALRRTLGNVDGTRPIANIRSTDPQASGAPRHFRLADPGILDVVTSRAPAQVTRFGAPSASTFSDEQAGQWPQLRWHELVEEYGLDIRTQLEAVPVEPYDSLASWARATRRHQAKVMKGTVETARRNKYGASAGYLQYYLRSPRPRWSYGIVDEHGDGNLAYAALRAASAPVLVMAEQFPTGLVSGDTVALGVHVISDLRRPLPGCRVDASVEDPAGTNSWSWGGDLDADSVTRVGTVDWTVPVGWGEVVLRLLLTTPDLRVRNHYQVRLPR